MVSLLELEQPRYVEPYLITATYTGAGSGYSD
jgi:hypothetical protein